MQTDNTLSLIIALKGQNPDTDGHVVRFGNKATLHILRKQVAEKLSILGGYDDIDIFDTNNNLLTDMDQIKKQKLVYIDLRDHIKDRLPGPTGLPYFGVLYDFFPSLEAGWLKHFKIYGPVVRIPIMGKEIIGTNSPEIAEIFLKESDYFTKRITKEGGLLEVKPVGGQGLVTTDTDDMDWKLAHKLLMPAFSARAIKAYQTEMAHITQQAIKVFEGYQPHEPVEILEWTTNITFETIGRIGFGYSFDLLVSRDQPSNEFIDAMGYCLNLAVNRIFQAEFIKNLPMEFNRKFDRGLKLMHDIVDQVINERKNSSDATDMNKDLLGYMLNARDEHQLGLSDENIRDQVMTFLIAGHDTTANTLAWCLYLISRHPDVQAKVLQEIADNDISFDKVPTSEQISKLKYLHQVLKETLRMYPPARAILKHCTADCILPGGFVIKADQSCGISTYAFHRNPNIYPEPDKFDPDRWTPEEEQKRSRFAWIPFSTGPRGCIGMAFALQEAKTVLSMLLHRFEFRYDGPDIQVDITKATTKPKDLFMTIHPRQNFPEAGVSKKTEPTTTTNTTTTPTTILPKSIVVSSDIELPPMTFLYGTQTGAAQDYATQLARQAKNFGFKNITVCEMNRWKVIQDGKFNKKNNKKNDQEIAVICTATYNGFPPDSAERFDKFLDFKMSEEGHESLLQGLSFAVFGLGNKNWRTYQSFPMKVSESLKELGADPFFYRGEGDADSDMDADFNEWCAHFWIHTLQYYQLNTASESKSIIPVAASTLNQTNTVQVKMLSENDNNNSYHEKSNAALLANYELQTEKSSKSTRHIEIDISQLAPVSEPYKYNVGDHLEIMPENSKQDVEAIARGFGFTLDSVFEIDQETIYDASPRSLAANIKGPCSVRHMLTHYADITSPPSRSMLGCFAAQLKSISPETATTFKELLMPNDQNQDQYPSFILKHRTLLDLQNAYPQVNSLDLTQFLTSVSVIQPRRYSVASSPLIYPNSVHLAVSVVDDVIEDKHYPGLASSFLKHSLDGAPIRAHLKSSKDTFSLPTDPSVPIIMISAGTGFAPFRGFLQHRKVQLEEGKQVGKTVLFFGCRHKEQDYIYKEELNDYVNSGVLSEKYVAFSRNEENSPIRYVQHQLVEHATDIWQMICPSDPTVKPASIFVCGGVNMSNDVRRTFCEMAVSLKAASNMDDANQFIDNLVNQHRYLCDVWS